MPPDNSLRDSAACIIIGAGMAGLMAARTLKAQGMPPVLLDKGRGVGGRMSTRRFDDYRFDHGAARFTADDSEIDSLCANWVREGVARKLPDVDSQGHSVNSYCGQGGMNAIPRHLASGLDVTSGCRVRAVSRQDEQWIVVTLDHGLFTAPAVILTAPVPQTLDMLAAGGIPLPEPDETSLRSVTYGQCIVLMAAYERAPSLHRCGMKEIRGTDVALVTDQHMKGVSPRPGAVTVHSTHDFAVAHWDSEPSRIESALLAGVRELLPGSPRSTQLHRWRYSQVTNAHPEACLVLERPGLLVLAGDAFGRGGVAGAARSGIAAGRRVAHYLTAR